MDDSRTARGWTARLTGLVGVLFGLASLAAGASVLAGRDPGYLVFRPLVWFNTAMGLPYILAGVLAWRRAPGAWKAAALIAGINGLVLGVIVSMHRSGGSVAIDSVRAMLLRSGLWLVLAFLAAWSGRTTEQRAVSAP